MATDYEYTPALPIGSTWFLDRTLVEVIDCEEELDGYACVKWFSHKGLEQKRVPIDSLMDLDEMLDNDPEYARYEAACSLADTMED